jgi:ABC-2 type transport system ATP-binding protein
MEIKDNGTTIVLVSHSTGQIEQICDRSIWIHEGLIRAQGMPRSVHREYLSYMGELRNKTHSQENDIIEETVKNDVSIECVSDKKLNSKYEHIGSGEILVKNVYVTDINDNKKEAFETSQDVIINVEYVANKPINKANFGISIFRNDGVCCCAMSTKDDDINFFSVIKNGSIKLIFNNIALLAGKYYVNVGIEDDIRNGIDYIDKACSFEVYTVKEEAGAFYLEHKWKLNI